MLLENKNKKNCIPPVQVHFFSIFDLQLFKFTNVESTDTENQMYTKQTCVHMHTQMYTYACIHMSTSKIH